MQIIIAFLLFIPLMIFIGILFYKIRKRFEKRRVLWSDDFHKNYNAAEMLAYQSKHAQAIDKYMEALYDLKIHKPKSKSEKRSIDNTIDRLESKVEHLKRFE